MIYAKTRYSMASDGNKKFEDLKDLNLTNDEVERLTNAFKKEEFRKLFQEYAEEIADPENRRRYEDEIKQMENERGMDIEFINPIPGFVVKTTYNGEQKAFINVCKNESIEKPKSQRQVGPDGRTGLSWSIPHSFAPMRDDVDKLGNKCKVFDFVIHPDTYRMSETNARFKKMILDTAFDGIEKQFDTKLDRKNMKFPKTTFKGTPTATVVRKKKKDGPTPSVNRDDILNSFPYPYDNVTSEEKAKMNEEAVKKRDAKKQENKSKTKKAAGEKPEDEYATPKYIIKHRSEIDFQDYRNAPDSSPSTVPKELVVEIDLPLLKSAAPVDLDIFEKRLTLQSTEPAKYKLVVDLPYTVDENMGSAKFDKSRRKLCITLPVINRKESLNIPLVNGKSESLVEPKENGELQVISDDNKSDVIVNGINGDHKPLIEVLSEHDETSATTEISSMDKPEQDIEAATTIVQPEIIYTLPNYDFHQDDETVSFILHAGLVDRSSMKLSHPTCNAFHIEMRSVGAGGFPIHYRLHVHFPATCALEVESCRADVDSHNVVVILVKTDASIGLWEELAVGLNEDSLQEKFFLTRTNLQKQLAGLSAEDGDTADTELSPELEVTEMDNEKLVVNFKEQPRTRRKKRMSESADDIEIVYDHQAPELHSIIKNRSVSESSDDIYGYARQNSTTSFNGSESSLIESDDNSEGTTRKKTVSFSEHIDQTTYKTNQSVSSMKATLKNKRKKQRKTERRQVEKQERRRRKSSGSEGASSDDMPVTKSKCAGDSGKGKLANLEVPCSSGYDVEGDDESSPTIDDSEKMKMKTKTWTARTSDSDQSENAEVTIEPGECGSESAHVSSASGVGDHPGVIKAVESECSDVKDSSTEVLDVRTKDCDLNVKPPEPEQLDSDDGEELTNRNPPKSHLIEELDPMNHHNREGVMDDSQKSTSKADTMLSWNDGPPVTEHSTKCAVDFANSVVFDLDDD